MEINRDAVRARKRKIFIQQAIAYIVLGAIGFLFGFFGGYTFMVVSDYDSDEHSRYVCTDVYGLNEDCQ